MDYHDSTFPSESQANCADFSAPGKPLSAECCSKSITGGCDATTVKGSMVEAVEHSNTLSSTKVTPRLGVSPKKSCNVNESCTSQLSPSACLSPGVEPLKSCTPNTLLASTAKKFRRTGWDKQRSLSSSSCVRVEDLHHPVSRVDEVVENCKNELHKKGIDCDNAGDPESYRQMLKRLENATETNKLWMRQKLKSKFAEAGSVGVNPSRMEARLSRYKADVYIILVQNELKRIAENFSVLKEFVKTQSVNRVQNSQISTSTKSASNDILIPVNSSDEVTSVKRRKLD